MSKILGIVACAFVAILQSACGGDQIAPNADIVKAVSETATKEFVNQVFPIRKRVASKENKDVDLKWYRNATQGVQRAPAEFEPQASESLGFGINKIIDFTNVALNAKVIRVHFGTSRMLETSANGERWITDGSANDVTLGFAIVSIPPNHRRGVIEQPVAFFSPSRAKHFTLQSVHEADRAYAMEMLKTELADRSTKRMIIYVHGYTESFQDGVFRSAQLAHDLEFNGPVAHFSWPAGSWKPLDYLAARQSIRWHHPYLKSYLSFLLEADQTSELVVVAHSLGAQIVSEAIGGLPSTSRRRIRELILASPDIDRKIFERDILPAVHAAGIRSTIYASSSDLALWFSDYFQQTRSMGLLQSDGGKGLKSHSTGIDWMDTTRVAGPGFWRHSDYATSVPVMRDISLLATQSLSPEQRPGLERASQLAAKRIWKVTGRIQGPSPGQGDTRKSVN